MYSECTALIATRSVQGFLSIKNGGDLSATLKTGASSCTMIWIEIVDIENREPCAGNDKLHHSIEL